ncbi:MAG: branched-chain amino acid ABC transporter substrate-binding protein [bacterium JZ-2024 1]
MNKGYAVAALAMGAVFLVLADCKKSGTQQGGKETEPIKIGLGAPITGPNSAFGIGMKNAMILLQEDWNDRGGVNGRKVEIIAEDDAGDPNQGRQVARKLVLSGVVAVVGHLNSSVTIPASEVYNEARIISITPASTNGQVTDRRLPYVFRVCWRDDQQGPFAADFVAEHLKIQRVAILDDRKTYGEGLANDFEARAKSLGLQIILRDHINPGEMDYRTLLTRIKAVKPQAIFYGGEYTEFGLLVKQARDIGMRDVYLISGDGSRDIQTYERAGGAKDLPGVFVSFGRLTDAMSQMEKRYKEKFGMDMNAFAPYTYVAGDLILQAIQATGKTDADTLAKYLKNTSFDTLVGKIEFDEKGDVKYAALEMEELRNREFRSVYSKEMRASHSAPSTSQPPSPGEQNPSAGG